MNRLDSYSETRLDSCNALRCSTYIHAYNMTLVVTVTIDPADHAQLKCPDLSRVELYPTHDSQLVHENHERLADGPIEQ